MLVVSRCVICHSVEIAVQQRQGPMGWGAIIDRMVTYGMPLSPATMTLDNFVGSKGVEIVGASRSVTRTVR